MQYNYDTLQAALASSASGRAEVEDDPDTSLPPATVEEEVEDDPDTSLPPATVEGDPDASLPPAVEPAEEARAPPGSSRGEEQEVCKISHEFVSFSWSLSLAFNSFTFRGPSY